MKLTWLFIVAVIVFALSSTTRLAYADDSDDTRVHACRNKPGNTRIVGANDLCKANETSKHWAITRPEGQQGIQGPKGDQGDQGPQGDTGPQGPKGDTGDTGAIDLSRISLRTCTDVFTCFCFENERVLGGGAECELPFSFIQLRNSSPIVEQLDVGLPREGWFAECTTGFSGPLELSTTRVVCIAP